MKTVYGVMAYTFVEDDIRNLCGSGYLCLGIFETESLACEYKEKIISDFIREMTDEGTKMYKSYLPNGEATWCYTEEDGFTYGVRFYIQTDIPIYEEES